MFKLSEGGEACLSFLSLGERLRLERGEVEVDDFLAFFYAFRTGSVIRWIFL